MAYAMTVHTPLGDEKFLLNLPVGEDCGSAHMFKGSFDFTEFRKVNETYFLSGDSMIPFDCGIRVECTPVEDLLSGVVQIVDPHTGQPMMSCPIDGHVSSNPNPWSEQ